METTQKILVVYYSRSGVTERVARDIASRLGADLEQITDLKNRSGMLGYLGGGRDAMKQELTEIGATEKDPADYDLIIIGTPVWAATMAPAVRTYIEKTKGQLQHTAFFDTAGGANYANALTAMSTLANTTAVASLGLCTKDLKSEKTYAQKLEEFITAVLQQK